MNHPSLARAALLTALILGSPTQGTSAVSPPPVAQPPRVSPSPAAAPAKGTPVAPQAPPSPPWIWDGEYRLRVTHVDQDQSPRRIAESTDLFVDHRLRLGLTVPVTEDVLVHGRFTTQASRWGDFDPTVFSLSTRRFDFDQLYCVYKPQPQTALIAGRGNNRYFEVDLASATGRFNEDDVQYEGFVAEHRPGPRTTLIGAYGVVLSTNLLDNNPLDVRLDGALIQGRFQFDPRHRLLLHAGSLYPKRQSFILPGNERADLGVIRYDYTPSSTFKAFVMVSRTLRSIDAFTFLPMTQAAADDRFGVFGGVILGDKNVRGDNQWELYFTRTGQGAQGLVTEFPSNIRELRGIWERQVGRKVFLRASLVHRALNVETPPALIKNDQDTAFAQVLTQF